MTESESDASGEPAVLRYFVDEAGDPVLFDRKGRVRVATEGCSRYFIMGKLDVAQPEELHKRLEALRVNLLADPYFKGVPSMDPAGRKTAVVFHAKDDLAEVRREVYKVLRDCDLRFYAVIRDKMALVKAVKQLNERDSGYRYRENDQYDALVSELFRHFRFVADETHVCFARRGAKHRTAAMYQALDKAKSECTHSYGFDMHGKFQVESSVPVKRAGLQAVDYYLWALQRYFERRESRFVEYIWPQVGEIHDLDKIADGRVGVIYSKNKPLITPDSN